MHRTRSVWTEQCGHRAAMFSGSMPLETIHAAAIVLLAISRTSVGLFLLLTILLIPFVPIVYLIFNSNGSPPLTSSNSYAAKIPNRSSVSFAQQPFLTWIMDMCVCVWVFASRYACGSTKNMGSHKLQSFSVSSRCKWSVYLLCTLAACMDQRAPARLFCFAKDKFS